MVDDSTADVSGVVDAAPEDDRPLEQLDDEADREVLRERYYGLLQELRTILPGAQILVAFLLTVPFSSRFGDLDDIERLVFGVALGAGTMAIVAFLTPTAIHRMGERQSRRARLRWGINTTRVGLGLLGLSLLSAVTAVYRFVFGSGMGAVAAVVTATTLGGLWVLLPMRITQWPRRR